MNSARRELRPSRHGDRLRRLAGIGAIIGLTLVVASCGDDDGPNISADGVETGTVTEAVTDEQTSLADTLRENGLTSAASALEQVDIEELIGTAEFTFFAPSDDAFLELDPDDMADLLADPDRLATTLQSHIVDERLTADQVSSMESISTVGGTAWDVSDEGGTVMVGDATVTATDIAVGDGIIHVVDRVLLP